MAQTAVSGSTARQTYSTIVLIASMIALVIAGFGFVAYQQEELDDLRETARMLRTTRQAAMEVDSAVLNVLGNPSRSTGIVEYAQALAKLNSHGDGHFPKTVIRDGITLPVSDVVRPLRSAWTDTIALTQAGDIEKSRATYVAQDIKTMVGTLVAAFFAELERIEARYSAIQKHLDLTILAVLVLQILTGVVCILAFLLASRSSARESKARALAVTSANASREQVSRLFEMTDMLQSASDHTDANAVLKASAAELIPGFSGALYVFNNSRDRLTLSTSWGRDNEDELPDTIGLQQCWALKRGKPHINRPESHKICCEHHVVTDLSLEIPMIARGEILGLLQIYAGGTDAETRLTGVAGLGAALADAMSLALANIALRDKLRSQALRDPLTGLYNRRYMEDTLQRVVRLAEREKHEVSVIMIDLDHFKRLNDQHGHAKGDAVLRDAAAAITNQLRDSDVACRYGGEELIVVLPNCGLDAAAMKAERLRASIEALSEPDGAKVSASFGVASIPATSVSAKDLVTNADAALYQAKQAGRNRVARASVVQRTPEGTAGDGDDGTKKVIELVAAE